MSFSLVIQPWRLMTPYILIRDTCLKKKEANLELFSSSVFKNLVRFFFLWKFNLINYIMNPPTNANVLLIIDSFLLPFFPLIFFLTRLFLIIIFNSLKVIISIFYSWIKLDFSFVNMTLLHFILCLFFSVLFLIDNVGVVQLKNINISFQQKPLYYSIKNRLTLEECIFQ